VVCFELDWHAFFLNVRLREKWVRLGPRAIRMDALSTIDGLRGVYAPAGRYARDLVRWVKACHRMKTLVRRRVIADAGWHFSWFGGLDAIAQKGSSISEHSHVSSGAKTAEWARSRMDGLLGNRDVYDLVALDDRLPAYVIAHPEVFGAHVMPVQG
jgi:beta-1,4-mannosyl-glycoprotein beta-1,4-N-acetylglucosaminyltransferase